MKKNYVPEILVFMFLVILYAVGLIILTVQFTRPSKEWANLLVGSMGFAGSLIGVIGIFWTTKISIQNSRDEFKRGLSEQRKEMIYWRMLDQLIDEQNIYDKEVSAWLCTTERELDIKLLFQDEGKTEKILNRLEEKRWWDLYQLYHEIQNCSTSSEEMEYKFNKITEKEKREKFTRWIGQSLERHIENIPITNEHIKQYNLITENPGQPEYNHEYTMLKNYYEEWKHEVFESRPSKISERIDLLKDSSVPREVRKRYYLIERLEVFAKQLDLNQDKTHLIFYKKQLSDVSLRI